jgi:thiol-disulfide isomerase/thioredoxin
LAKQKHHTQSNVPHEGHEHAVHHSKKSPETSSYVRISVIIIIAVLAIALVVWGIKSMQSKPSEGIAAKVGNLEISMEELNKQYDVMPEYYTSMISKGDYLMNVMVPEKMLLQKSEGITSKEVEETYNNYLKASNMTQEQVEQVLTTQGVTIPHFKELVKIQIYLNKTLYSRVQVTEDEALSFYESSKESLLDENGSLIPYDVISAEIKSYLMQQKLQEETQKYVQELKEEFDVQIFYKSESTELQQSSSDLVDVEDDSQASTTFTQTADKICTADGKPIIRLFSTTTCPHCKWIKSTFDETVKQYVKDGKVVAFHWEMDAKDNTLTDLLEGSVPASEMEVFKKYDAEGYVPAFVFGCKYYRIGNGYESEKDLAAEKAEFEALMDELIAEAASQ